MSVCCYILRDMKPLIGGDAFLGDAPEPALVVRAPDPAALVDQAEAVDTLLHLAMPFLALAAVDER